MGRLLSFSLYQLLDIWIDFILAVGDMGSHTVYLTRACVCVCVCAPMCMRPQESEEGLVYPGTFEQLTWVLEAELRFSARIASTVNTEPSFQPLRKFLLHLFIFVYMYRCGGQKRAWGSWFSASVMWIPGIKLGLSALAASTFIHWAITLALLNSTFHEHSATSLCGHFSWGCT